MSKFKAEHSDATFQVQWHPFYLDPTLSSEGVDKMTSYKAKFGEARMAQMLPYMQEVGRAEGIDFSVRQTYLAVSRMLCTEQWYHCAVWRQGCPHAE